MGYSLSGKWGSEWVKSWVRKINTSKKYKKPADFKEISGFPGTP